MGKNKNTNSTSTKPIKKIIIDKDAAIKDYLYISEEKFWEMVDSLNWVNVSKNHQEINKDVHKFRMLQKYSLEEWKAMFEKHREKYSALRTYLWTVYSPDSGGLGLGDDGTWDICAHILGLGYDEYIKAFKEPDKVLLRAKNRDYVECFSYWIPQDEDYTLPNSMDMIFKND